MFLALPHGFLRVSSLQTQEPFPLPPPERRASPARVTLAPRAGVVLVDAEAPGAGTRKAGPRHVPIFLGSFGLEEVAVVKRHGEDHLSKVYNYFLFLFQKP